MKHIAAAFIIACITFAVGVFVTWQWKNPSDLLSAEQVLAKIERLNRLETITFYIDTIISKESEQSLLPFGLADKKMLYVVKGRVSAGVDLAQLNAEHIKVDIAQNLIELQLPPAKILHRYVDSGTTYTLKSGIMSGSDTEFANTLHEEAKTALLRTACTQNILQLAQENAERELENLFSMIDIQVKVIPSNQNLACKI